MVKTPRPLDQSRLVVSILRAWPSEALATLALERRGFGNTDVGCGLCYPGEQDPDEATLPVGCVQLYGGWGDEFEFELPEGAYLRILEAFLRERGLNAAAARVAVAARALEA